MSLFTVIMNVYNTNNDYYISLILSCDFEAYASKSQESIRVACFIQEYIYVISDTCVSYTC